MSIWNVSRHFSTCVRAPLDPGCSVLCTLCSFRQARSSNSLTEQGSCAMLLMISVVWQKRRTVVMGKTLWENMKKKDFGFFFPSSTIYAVCRAMVGFGSWCFSVLCPSLTFALTVRCENYECHCLPSECKFTQSCDFVDVLIFLMQRSPGRTISLKSKQWWNVKKREKLINNLYFFCQDLANFLFLWFVTVPHISELYFKGNNEMTYYEKW